MLFNKKTSKSLMFLTIFICLLLILPISFANDVDNANITISISDNSDILSANKDIYVSTAGDDNWDGASQATAYKTISKALSQVSSGDKANIYIAEGTYNESNLVSSQSNIDLSIIGSGNVTIDAQNNNRIFYFSGDGSSINFKNLNLINGKTTGSDRGGAILFGSVLDRISSGTLNVDSVNFTNNAVGNNAFGGALATLDSIALTVTNSIFDGNSAAHGGAFRTTSSTKVINSTFVNNKATNDYGGAIGINGGTTEIIGCVFEGNSARRGGAIGIYGCTAVNVTHCVLLPSNIATTYNTEILWFGQSEYYKTRVSIDNNWWGVDGVPSGYGDILGLNNYIIFNVTTEGSTIQASLNTLNTGDLLLNPELLARRVVRFSGNVNPISCLTNEHATAVSEFLGGSSPQVTVTVDDVSKDIGIAARTIYVSNGGNDANDGSQERPLLTIARAITLAKSNSNIVKIFVKNGIYNESGLKIDNNIEIVGQSKDEVIINGNLNTILNNTAITKLTNLTFKNARNYFTNTGGALVNSGNLTLTNCTFFNNTVYNNPQYDIHGAGIYSTGALNIINCYFDTNQVALYSHSYGGAIYTTGPTNITNSTFKNNRAYRGGGAIYSTNDLTVFNSIFDSNYVSQENNWAGAIYQNGGVLNITKSVFINNSAYNDASNIVILSGTTAYSINYCIFLNGTDDVSLIWVYNRNSALDANYNYFGTNDNPKDLITYYENETFSSLDLEKWTILDVKPSGYAHANETISLNIDFTKFSNGESISELSKLMPDLKITLTPTIGEINTPTVSLVNGLASLDYTSNVQGEEIINIYANGVYVGNITFKVYDDESNMIFVSTTGDDSASGSRDNPLLTLTSAIAKNKAEGGFKTICIFEGTYTANDLIIDDDVTIMADNDAIVTITGNNIITSNVKLNLINLKFMNSKNTIVNNGELAVENCVFDSNDVAILDNNKVTITSSNFTNNDNAIYAKGNLEVTDSNFINNAESIAANGATLKLINNQFTNTSTNSINSDIELTNNIMENSPITVSGGFIKKTTLSFKDLEVEYGNPVTLTANVSDDNGNLINGGIITFTIDGTAIGSADVVNGVATYNYAQPEDGQHIISGTYSLDSTTTVNDGQLNVKIYKWFIGDVGYTTLSLAIEAAKDGDIIEGLEGTYDYSSAVIVNKNVTIQPRDNAKIILDGTKSGRILYIYTDFTVNLINLTLTNAHGYSNGGAVYNYGYLTVINCTFTNNRLTGELSYLGANGAAIHSYSHNLTVINSTFKDNQATCGGAIYIGGYDVIDEVFFTVDNCIFENNNATSTGDAGGAIYIYSSINFNITNSKFIGNKAVYGTDDPIIMGGTGGAIHIYSSAKGSVEDSEFNNNLAYYWGGAIQSKATTDIINCTFTSNAVYRDGGAIHGHFNIYNSTFKDNEAITRRGGALCGEGNSMIYNSIFENNTAPEGGAIFAAYNGKDIQNCIFIDNYAEIGGAIYNYHEYADISDCHFIENNATYGGAIANAMARDGSILNDVVLTNCEFLENYANYGGALYSNSSDSDYPGIFISDSSFENNTAKYDGGAIFGDIMEIDNVEFTLNNAGDYGGAIENTGRSTIVNSIFNKNTAFGSAAIDNTGILTIEKSYFGNNKASRDAGAVSNMNQTKVINSKFINNIALRNGGAIKNQGEKLTVESSEFIENSVEGYSRGSFGGAVYDWIATSEITDSKFINNYAATYGGAIYSGGGSMGSSTTEISKSIFIGNDAPKGGAIYAGNADVIVNYSVLLNNTNDAVYADPAVLSLDINNNWWGENNPDWSNVVFGADSPSIYAVLNVTCNPEYIAVGQLSDLTFALCANGTNNTVSRIPVRDIVLSAIGGELSNLKGKLNDIFESTFTLKETDNVITAIVDNEVFTFSFDLREVSSIEINTEDIIYGDSLTVTVNVNPKNATGNVSVIIDNVAYSAVVNNGVATLNIANLNAGTHSISARYSGDDVYTPARTSTTINVSKNSNYDLNVEIPSISEEETAVIVLSVPGEGNITITVDGKTYDAGVKDGKSTVSISNLSAGIHNMTISYSGDSNYSPKEINTKIDVAKLKDYNITVDIPKVHEGEKLDVVVNLPDDATGSVSIAVNGKTYIGEVKEGKSIVSISELLTGNYNLVITYSGDKNYKSRIINENAIVIAYIITAPDVVKYYGDSKRFAITITDSEGKKIANASAEVIINGVKYTRFTDVKGETSLPLNLNSGNYTIQVSAFSKSVNSTVTIKSTVMAYDLTKVYRNASQFYATFLDSNGNLLTNTTVSFNINGVFYYRTTDEKGVAGLTINLNQGEYILTAINPANNEMHTNIVTVIARLVDNHDITKLYRNGTQYSLRAIGEDGNSVGAGELVTFNINGVFYNRTTDENGIVTLNINLQPGDYIITAEYANCRVSNNIKVEPVLFAENLQMSYMDGSRFEAKLVDGQGNPYPNQKITFNINGVFYDRTTDSDGIARLNINLMSGKYIITSSYNGLNIANTILIS